MAEILPLNTELNDIQEGSIVSQSFSASLGAEETLVELKIIKYEETDGIIVGDSSYSGAYNNVFTFSKDAIKYRKGNELKVASSWDEIPEDADIYEWRAPRNLQRTFSYTVMLTYSLSITSSPGETGVTSTTEEHTIYKTYNQLVYGNWNIWADKLRAFVYNRG